MRLGQVRRLVRHLIACSDHCSCSARADNAKKRSLRTCSTWRTSITLLRASVNYVCFDSALSRSVDRFARLRRLIGAVEVTEEQPWKLVTFCVQTVEDAADVSKRNKGGFACLCLPCSSIVAVRRTTPQRARSSPRADVRQVLKAQTSRAEIT